MTLITFWLWSNYLTKSPEQIRSFQANSVVNFHQAKQPPETIFRFFHIISPGRKPLLGLYVICPTKALEQFRVSKVSIVVHVHTKKQSPERNLRFSYRARTWIFSHLLYKVLVTIKRIRSKSSSVLPSAEVTTRNFFFNFIIFRQEVCQ